MQAFWNDHWPFVMFSVIAGTVLGVAAWADANTPPAPCVTHVPDPERHPANGQCRLGAHVEAVNGVALCVCPTTREGLK